MSARTGVRQQFGNVEKEMRKYLQTKCSAALMQIGKDALKKVADRSYYTPNTYNLMDSTGFAIYHKNEKKFDMSLSMVIAGVEQMATKQYVVRGNKSLTTRYGGTISLSDKETLSGSKLLNDAIEGYSSTTKGGYINFAELVIFSEMFYRYFLEEKKLILGMLELENEVVNGAVASLKRHYGDSRVWRDPFITAKPKGFIDEDL